MRRIFSDFNIIRLIRDNEAPGVFLKARKPIDYKSSDLQHIALYSVILGRRTTSIPDIKDMPMIRKLKFIGGENLLKLGRFIINQLSVKLCLC